MIKKVYQYLFYKIYKFCDSMPNPWWSDAKAMSIIDILIVFFVGTIYVYYNIYIDQSLDLISDRWYVLIFLIVTIFIPNYFFFFHKKKCKKIIEEFDKLPKKTNMVGGWLVFLFICIILMNFFYSIYLMGQVDWSQYR